ncbi:MAG TPA: hypothetical protein PLX57_08610 [Ornithinibacter sp.]|nr:hypothetical protein [Ornithinibacter sp.]HQW73909.1 hypothetical protein [Ornithinibacter sp.]
MTDVVLADLPDGVDEAAWLSACATVRAYCGWHVAPLVTETVTLDGRGRCSYFLPTLRLVDLVSLAADGVAVDDPEWSSMGEVRGVHSNKLRGIVAEIVHGLEECPADVLKVLHEMAAAGDRDGVTSVTSGQHQVSFETGAPTSRQRAALNRYRLVGIA